MLLCFLKGFDVFKMVCFLKCVVFSKMFIFSKMLLQLALVELGKERPISRASFQGVFLCSSGSKHTLVRPEAGGDVMFWQLCLNKQ